MRTTATVTAALAAAVVVSWVATLPPHPLPSSGAADPAIRSRTLRGAFHVHTTRSDGAAAKPVVAAAAARAGLQFIVFTDHGDGTRAPDPPEYSLGVLCLDAVEISTAGGHYVALGLPRAPYRLGGEPSAVVEDVRRLGGFGIAAHPDSPRSELAWRDWTPVVDGLEWLNADSEWRRGPVMALSRRVLDYFVRPGPALAAILARPTETLERWDRMSAARPVAAFVAHDAHGGGRRAAESGGLRLPGIPSYESSFRSFSTVAVLAAPLNGNALRDAALLIDALKGGWTYSVVDGAAGPGWLEFSARRQGFVAGMGESIAGAGPVTLTARASSAGRSSIAILHDGVPVAETQSGSLSASVNAPGSYRVEVRLDGSATTVPWILGNPIYVDLPPATVEPVSTAIREVVAIGARDWHVEKDPASGAELATEGADLGVRFRLRPGSEASQFVALSAQVAEGDPPFDRILIDATSDAPLRLSLQLRSQDGRSRWGTSLYFSSGSRPQVVQLRDLLPLERGQPATPEAVRSVLLVIDLVNAIPAFSGRLVVHRLALGTLRPAGS